MSRSRDPPSEKETLLTWFQKQIKVKKVTLILQLSFARKIKAEPDRDLQWPTFVI